VDFDRKKGIFSVTIRDLFYVTVRSFLLTELFLIFFQSGGNTWLSQRDCS